MNSYNESYFTFSFIWEGLVFLSAKLFSKIDEWNGMLKWLSYSSSLANPLSHFSAFQVVIQELGPISTGIGRENNLKNTMKKRLLNRSPTCKAISI